MHTEPRNGASIDRIYLHTNEGPEQPGGANGLAHYLLNNGPDGGGYHAVDGDTLVRIANDDTIVWGAGGDNTHTLHLVFEGYANQTPAQWADAFSAGELDRAVGQVTAWCKAYNIPAVKFSPGAPGQAPTGRGIGEHAYDHSPNSEGHTDPGTGFPIDAFIARVAAEVTPLDWNAIKALVDFERTVSMVPLRYLERRTPVLILKQLLARRGYTGLTMNTLYGDELSTAVGVFKRKEGLANVDPHIFGADAAHAILK